MQGLCALTRAYPPGNVYLSLLTGNNPPHHKATHDRYTPHRWRYVRR